MNIKKEKIKMKIFITLYIVFAILDFIGAFIIITKKLNRVGYVVIPMLFAIISSMFYRNSKKVMKKIGISANYI